MPKTYTLIIWENIPEFTELYLIPNDRITPEIQGYLNLAHGRYINGDDHNDGLEFINAAVTEPQHMTKPEECPASGDETFSPPSKLFFDNQCLFHEFLVAFVPGKPLVADGPITQVVHTGFLM